MALVQWYSGFDYILPLGPEEIEALVGAGV